MLTYIAIIFSAILVNNIVFAQFQIGRASCRKRVF